jgi:hypothetical protein
MNTTFRSGQLAKAAGVNPACPIPFADIGPVGEVQRAGR